MPTKISGATYTKKSPIYTKNKLYIQKISKDVCIDLKQKETELLVGYRAEIDSLYQQRPINYEEIDEIQNKMDLIE